jgi:glycine betaine/proline transport system permease protein
MVNLQRLNTYFELRKRDWWILGAFAALVILILLLNAMQFEVSSFPAEWNIGLRQPIDAFQGWVIGHRAESPIFLYFFDPLSNTIDIGIRGVENFLLWLPWVVIVVGMFLVGHYAGGLRLGLLCVAGLLFMGMVGLWNASMQTLALMGVSVFIALLIGIPLGILTARYDKLETALRPILDGMQTMPAFVYLIPVVLFFGIARVPGVVATVIYALPPAIRLTNLGIRGVPAATIEAATAFGSTQRQTLFKVQLPLAMPSIIIGVNQTIMMALGIVVIAALIGAGGLGREVLVSLQRLQVGQGLEAGLAIVFMAIMLDRVSHAASKIDFTNRPREAHDFRLFPSKWARFDLIWAFEQGLNGLYVTVTAISKAVATGVAALVSPLVRALGFKHAPEATPGLLRTYSYAITGGLLLLVLLLISLVVPFLNEFPTALNLSLRGPVDTAVAWSLSDFLTIYLLNPLRLFLQGLPWVVVILAVALIAWAAVDWRLALLAAAGMFGIGLLGMWEHAMDTLSQTIVAVIVSLLIAIPVGILASRSDAFAAFLRPILDTLQTIPPFVYLVPVIMLFNVGRIPGIIASVLYALPPAIRLTNLGIREIPEQTIEAATAFGSTPRQTLFKVQLPLALPSIMVGINQTIMMVLSMVIIAGLVGGGGLGLESVIGLAKNQTGRGVEAGIAIVILAIIIDRITQAWGKKRDARIQGN